MSCRVCGKPVERRHYCSRKCGLKWSNERAKERYHDKRKFNINNVENPLVIKNRKIEKWNKIFKEIQR